MQALEETRAAPIIRLGVLTTISTRAVGELLAGFKRQAPDVVIEIVDGTEQELLNRLDDRSLDYALSVHRGADKARAIPLWEEGYVFILAADHALASRTRLTAADLAEEHMVVRSRCEVLSETSRYFTDQNIRPRLVYRTPNDSRAIAMVSAGLGGTVVPESLVDERVTAARLQGFDYKRRLALYRPRYELPQPVAGAGQQFEVYVSRAWRG